MVISYLKLYSMLCTGARFGGFYFVRNDLFYIFHFWNAKRELDKLLNFSEKVL